MKYLKIDEEEITLSTKDKTLVDTIRRAKKSITAPCYKTMRKFGTCESCLVYINGEKMLACGNAPSSNIDVILNDQQLIEERKNKVRAFKKHVEMMEKFMGK